MRVVIDSSVLVALLNVRDSWHSRATVLAQSLIAHDATLIYFDCVVTETISAAVRRLHEKGDDAAVKALMDALEARVPSSAITWILPWAPDLYEEAIGLIRSTNGELNFNDALIGLACRELEVPVIASFDPDFDGISWLQRWSQPDQVTPVSR